MKRKYRVVLKDDGLYYPQEKRFIWWRDLPNQHGDGTTACYVHKTEATDYVNRLVAHYMRVYKLTRKRKVTDVVFETEYDGK